MRVQNHNDDIETVDVVSDHGKERCIPRPSRELDHEVDGRHVDFERAEKRLSVELKVQV